MPKGASKIQKSQKCLAKSYATYLSIYPFISHLSILFAGLFIKDSLSFLKYLKCEETLKVVTHKRH